MHKKEREEWRLVSGSKEVFVSNFGRVMTTNYRGRHQDKILEPFLSNGSWRVCVNRKSCLVQRLVAKAFLGDIPAGYVVRHKNGVSNDCRAENLEICARAKANAMTALQGGKRRDIPVLAYIKGSNSNPLSFPSIIAACRTLGLSRKQVERNLYRGVLAHDKYVFRVNTKATSEAA